MATSVHPEPATSGLAAAVFALGFALSGFFDGVLLHQILQWHHLLSALDGDLRFQIAADGWYHVLMYAIAGYGLWRLWKARAALGTDAAGRVVAAWGLIGFGTWHVVDAVGSHWLLGIHRIRMDAAYPLAWDIGWLAVFGIAPLAAGWRLLANRPPPDGTATGARGSVAAITLALAVVSAGTVASRPPSGPVYTTIVFGPSVHPRDAVLTALSAGGSLVWSGDGVVVTTRVTGRATIDLYRRGAL